MTLQVGVHLNQSLQVDLPEQVRLVEQAGFHRAWFADAFWPPDGLDAVALVGLALQVAPRISVGVNVFNTAVRRAQDLARFAASIEGLFPGRFVIGLGAGRSRYGRTVASAWGYPLRSSADQLAYFGDTLAYLRQYFSESAVTYSGTHLGVTAAEGSPFLGGRRPPTLVAGHTDDILGLVAEYADLWEGMAVWGMGARSAESREDFFARTLARLRHLCIEVGRDPSSIVVCQTLYVAIAPSMRGAELIAESHRSDVTRLSCVGTPRDLTATLRRLGESGVGEVQLVPLDRHGRAGMTEAHVLQLIGDEVLPAL